MNKLFVAFGLVFSMNASAIDLSKDVVASPEADAHEITEAISERGALRLTPVTCRRSGTPDMTIVKCDTTRRIIYPDNTEDQTFGCWFEYTENADGTYLRTYSECPIF